MSGIPPTGSDGCTPHPPYPPFIPARHPHHDAADPNNPTNLHVIAVYFNFNRFDNPLKNFQTFQRHMATLGVTLHVVELVLGSRPFEVTDAANPLHTQLRTESEFFQKENLINQGAANAFRLFPDLEYLAWVDGDLHFFNANVAVDTMHQLNRHRAVSMWAMAFDLGPDGLPMTLSADEASRVRKSFGFSFHHGLGLTSVTKRWGMEWHTGYAWAMRRSTWDAIGGLYENSVVGSADNNMAWAFIGKEGWGLDPASPPALKIDLAHWCRRAIPAVAGDVGYVNGLIHHHWHGRKTDRQYVSRMKILSDHDFDPRQDLWKDARGLLHLTGHKTGLVADLRRYMQSRNDDANTLA
jgi:hypothetical protein